MKIFTIQNGCESNLYDSEKAKMKLLLNKNNIYCNNKEDSDIIIYHACTFTQQKEDETKEKIDVLLKGNVKQVIVTGCYLSEYINNERVKYIKNDQLLNYLNQLPINAIKEGNLFKNNNDFLPFVQISKGCYGNCTFCSIKKVKGNHKSRSIEEILSDIEKRKHHGFVKLVGEEVTGYGLDIGKSLKNLVDEIVDRHPTLKIKFGSLNAKILKNFKKEELAVFSYKNVTGNIHIPIQSASNVVLKKMRRGYTIEEYCNIYDKLKELGVKNISADIISGFPGEDEIAHKQNIDFLNNHNFEFMEIFAYQERIGTIAATFEQIDYIIRKRRTIELIANYINSYCNRNSITIKELVNTSKIFNTNIFK